MDTPDPITLGTAFVRQYYAILHEQPESLHSFYGANAECTYGGETDDGKTAKGVKDIEKLLSSNGLVNAKVALSTLDCQSSAGGGILISVVGKLFNKDESPQKFVQSFFLEPVDGSYYVRNDVFRFLVEEEYAEEPALDEEEEEEEEEEVEEEEEEEEEEEKHVEPTPVAAQTQPAPEPAVPTPTPTPVAQEVSSSASTEQATPAQPSQQANTAPETKAAAPAASSSQPAAAAEKKGAKEAPAAAPAEKKPFSWASIVGTSSEAPKESERPAPPKPTAKPATKASASTGAQAPSLQAQRERPAVQLPQKSNSSKPAPLSPVLTEGCSIYVSGLPFDCTEEKLQNVFAQYGRVRHIVLKAAKQFAFVEYENAQALQQALIGMRDKPPAIEGRGLVIEERKPRSGSSGPLTGSPRGGRGGRGGAARGGGSQRGGGIGGGPTFGAGAAAGGRDFIDAKGRGSRGGAGAGAGAGAGGAGGFNNSPRAEVRKGGGDAGPKRGGGAGGGGGGRNSAAAAFNNSQSSNNNNNMNNNTHNNAQGGGVPRGGGQQQPKASTS